MVGAFVGAVAFSGATAEAFAPTARPWSSTPERFLQTVPDHRAPIVSPVLDGMTVYAYRTDGRVALVWGGANPAPSNLSADDASAASLELVRAMAFELGVEPADLYVRDASMLEAWGNVTIGQRAQGIEVPRGFVQVTLREGSIAAIRNELVLVKPDEAAFEPDVAAAIALSAAKAFAPDSELVSSARREYWAPTDRGEDARLAYAVKTTSAHPPSALTFHIDARTKAILAADDEVRFAEGEGRVRIVVDAVTPGDSRSPHTAIHLDLDGLETDSDGEALRPSSATATYEGPYVRIRDEAGQLERFSIDLSGPFGVVDHTPRSFSQADPFVHLNRVNRFARSMTPSLDWLDRTLVANVNINETCNAFWNGLTVNFFRSGGGCNNTGQIASIVYHEFGHGYHGNLTRNVVGSIGEGSGDFLAGTLLDDPVVGRGFSTDGSGIRRIDRIKTFPADYVNAVHQDGLIWATALWRLRAALIEKLGEREGRRAVDRAFALALTQGPGLSTAYPAILSADDDDQDPSNGTPNSCEINAIFEEHGLVDGGQINHRAVPTRSYVRIVHAAPGRVTATDEGLPLEVTTENRSVCGTYDPSALVLHYAIGDAPTFDTTTTAIVPGVVAGDVVRYWFSIDAEGSTYTLGTEASPMVALADVDDELIFEETFEGDFGAWQHGPISGDLHDDWEIGAPHGLAGDPIAARSGSGVAGTDLGAGGGPGGTDGAAKPGRPTYLESPPMTTAGMQSIRLELWESFDVDGALTVLVDGEIVHTRVDAASDGWRFATFALPERFADRAEPFTVRFEVEPATTNARGGWTIDDVRLRGAPIPPPPPPPPPPPEPPKEPPKAPPMETPPGPVETPTSPPGALDRPGDEAPAGLHRGALGGGCQCVRAPTARGALALLGLLFFVARRRR